MMIATQDKVLTFDPEYLPGPLYNPRVQINFFVPNWNQSAAEENRAGHGARLDAKYAHPNFIHEQNVQRPGRVCLHAPRSGPLCGTVNGLSSPTLHPVSIGSVFKAKQYPGNVIADEASVSFTIKHILDVNAF